MGISTFTFGENDNTIGQRTMRFKGESGRTYLVSFASFTKYDENGLPSADSGPAFASVQRIYKAGIGNVIVDDENKSTMEKLLKQEAKQYIGTILCVWPTDKDGDLDVDAFKAGKGWKVMPWIFSSRAYPDIARCHKKFPLQKHDISMTCSDANFQQFTMVSDPKSCLRLYLDSKNEGPQQVGKKIIEEAHNLFNKIGREFGREMTVDEVREALGEEVSSSSSSSSSSSRGKSIERALDDLDI